MRKPRLIKVVVSCSRLHSLCAKVSVMGSAASLQMVWSKGSVCLCVCVYWYPSLYIIRMASYELCCSLYFSFKFTVGIKNFKIKGKVTQLVRVGSQMQI